MHYQNIKSRLSVLSLDTARVFLRADLNITQEECKNQHSYKVTALLPTLHYLQKHNAKIILATHWGNPIKYDAKLSTQRLMPLFEKCDLPVDFASTLNDALEKSFIKNNTLVLLENLRFHPEEKKPTLAFAQTLKELADFYVNDAFGSVHRSDCSLVLLPTLFEPEKRTCGFLIEREIQALNLFFTQPQPHIIIMGGAKIATKLPFITKMLEKNNTLLVCPPLSFTLEKAEGLTVGKSLVDDSMILQAQEILRHPRRNSLHMPLDYQIMLNGNYLYVDAGKIPENAQGIAIGPKTIAYYKEVIHNAKALFFNGIMGFPDKPQTMEASLLLLKMIAGLNAYTIIGGGDTISFAESQNLLGAFDVISTGGGATLAFLSGEALPALDVLSNRTKT